MSRRLNAAVAARPQPAAATSITQAAPARNDSAGTRPMCANGDSVTSQLGAPSSAATRFHKKGGHDCRVGDPCSRTREQGVGEGADPEEQECGREAVRPCLDEIADRDCHTAGLDADPGDRAGDQSQRAGSDRCECESTAEPAGASDRLSENRLKLPPGLLASGR